MQTPEKVIHRIATPAAVTSHLPLRKQNQDLLEKRSTETSELRQQIRELKVALEQATQERSDLQVELFEHTQALKVSFNEQERKLRQAKVDRMLSLQPQPHDPSTIAASQFERQHGALGGVAFDARHVHEEVLALRDERDRLKRTNASLERQLVKARTRVHRLEANGVGVSAAVCRTPTTPG